MVGVKNVHSGFYISPSKTIAYYTFNIDRAYHREKARHFARTSASKRASKIES